MNYKEFLNYAKKNKNRTRDKNVIYPNNTKEKYFLLGEDIRKLNDLDSFADYVEFCMKSEPIFNLFLTYGGVSKNVKTYKDMTDGIMNHFVTFVWNALYIPLTNCFYEERIKECVKHDIDGDIQIYI
jgi:hypothetical protein